MFGAIAGDVLYRAGASHDQCGAASLIERDFFIDKLTTITTADFEQQVLESDLPIVVDFGAPWCPPCRAVAPILENLAGEFAGRLTIVSVNTDEEPGLAQRFRIVGLPTMVVFKGGTEVQRVRGAAPERVLKEAFASALAS